MSPNWGKLAPDFSFKFGGIEATGYDMLFAAGFRGKDREKKWGMGK